MKKRALALVLTLCLVIGTVGHSPFANAKGESVARLLSLSSEEEPSENAAPDSENAPADKEPGSADAPADKEPGSADAPKEDTGAPADTELEQKITTSDGSTYDIEVSYREDSGIPMSKTELLVTELKPGDAAYDDYIKATAEKLGIAVDKLQLSRVFDIRIVDANNHDTVYEPATEVKVSITLVDEDLSRYANVDIVHFTEETKSGNLTAENLEETVEGETVEFTTDSFSVYVVVAHEEEAVVATPRVMFHFIDRNPVEHTGDTVYYEGAPYEFRNKSENGDLQTTQILKDGEALELINDPGNTSDRYFYGWHIVTPYAAAGANTYGINTTDGKLYYTWPDHPESIAFEQPVSIEETDVAVGGTIHWSLNGVAGEGILDEDGCIHVLLAPVYENYHFVNFMLYPRDSAVSGASNLMTRKMVAVGSAETAVEVKISDIRATSTDSVHLIFAGWEYNAGTAENPQWVRYPTVDYFGAEIKEEGKDGVYISVTSGNENIDLFPIFIQARWVDFVAGPTGSGAVFVGSRFLREWTSLPDQTPEEGKNIFTSLATTTRKGYLFDGWYAYAVTDPETGEILNLDTEMPVTVTYIDNNLAVHETTITTRAVRITDENGAIAYDGAFAVTDGGESYPFFSAANGELRLYFPLDRLTLYANWIPDESKVTIVYWTENAADDNYSSSAVKTINTTDIGQKLNKDFTSGHVITLADLMNYHEGDDTFSVVNPKILDDVKAVPAGQEIFYDLCDGEDDRPAPREISKTIDGSENTVFNVYYRRKIFKLVFHIGRDGYVKTSGSQKTDEGWDYNWIEYMFKDDKVTRLGYTGKGGQSQRTTFGMTFEGKTYDSTYVTTNANVMGDYVPDPENDPNDQNVYVITAKYGAYIGDRWPSPSNPRFTFTPESAGGRMMYTWAAFYGSLYCRIANERPTWAGQQGNNPDLNGVYDYMSAELCSNRAGTDVMPNQVHHIVAYFGPDNNADRVKVYHVLYEAVPGTYDPENVDLHESTEYAEYPLTTWSTNIAHVDWSAISGKTFYEVKNSATNVISNVNPEFQMGWDRDGYNYVFSCYRNGPGAHEHHVYFFYSPIIYPLTFKYENEEDRKTDDYYYGQPLAEARKYQDPEKEGYRFLGWYTNEAGQGEPFDFANETMPNSGVVLYPVFEKLNYIIRIDPNGAEIDHWRENALSAGASTGFRADYKETIAAYDYLECRFVPTNDVEIAALSLTADELFYYLNTQYISEEHDGKFIPAKLRNALYLTADEIDAYWAWYSEVPEEDFAERGAVKFTDKNEWMDAYFGGHDLSTLQKYRGIRGAERYTFMGWYQVYADGTVDTAPFNFNTQVVEDLEIRAMWRLEGGFYVQYIPFFCTEEDGVFYTINGEIEQWTDPVNPVLQLYADRAWTRVLRAPTRITDDWVFRGWRVVRANGTITHGNSTYTNWEPAQLDANGDPVYYQPGDEFTIDSKYMTEGGSENQGAVIYMQAYYEKPEHSYRRPEIANLILDANDDYNGYVVTEDSTVLPVLPGSGSSWINNQNNLFEGRPTQIWFGDIQSNLALHLHRYATVKTFGGITGNKVFAHKDGYLLLGFDEASDPLAPSTGSGFIPAYFADAVIAVPRTESKTLYAMWEPLVYVTFVNTTEEDITVDLTGTSSTVNVVNAVTGEFDREKSTTRITVPAKSGDENGVVKVVLPLAVAGTDTFTANALNTHLRKVLSVTGEFRGASYGNGTEEVRYGSVAAFTGTLQTDATGVIVTYTEEPEKQVVFDVNEGVWTETSDAYEQMTDDVYAINENNIEGNAYRPADPEKEGKVFLGWTTNEDIASHSDFSGTEAVTWGETVITPDAGGIIFDKISAYLWDFTMPPPYTQVLYAVWSDAVTVTFDITYTVNPQRVHVWNGPEPVAGRTLHAYYTLAGDTNHVYYLMAKGELLPKPSNPTQNSAAPNWGFLKWLVYTTATATLRDETKAPYDSVIVDNTFDFSQRLQHDQTLTTSWMQFVPQVFTFTVENRVVNDMAGESFDYLIEVVDEQAIGKFTNNNSTIGTPDPRWGSATATLKNNQAYTVVVTVTKMTRWSNDGDFSVVIDVFDSEGMLVKSGNVINCPKNTYKEFASDYKLTLRISQQPKTGFETSVAVPEDSVVNLEDDTYGTDEGIRAFSVDISYGRSNNANFKPYKNGYEDGKESEATIVFTNTGVLIAPTAVPDTTKPLWAVFFGGLALLLAAVVFGRRRRA